METKSKFVTTNDVDSILDKVNKLGNDWFTDIDKNRISLFNEGDEKLLSIVDNICEAMNDLCERVNFVYIIYQKADNNCLNEIDRLILEADRKVGALNLELNKYGYSLKDETILSLLEEQCKFARLLLK